MQNKSVKRPWSSKEDCVGDTAHCTMHTAHCTLHNAQMMSGLNIDQMRQEMDVNISQDFHITRFQYIAKSTILDEILCSTDNSGL